MTKVSPTVGGKLVLEVDQTSMLNYLESIIRQPEFHSGSEEVVEARIEMVNKILDYVELNGTYTIQ